MILLLQLKSLLSSRVSPISFPSTLDLDRRQSMAEYKAANSNQDDSYYL